MRAQASRPGRSAALVSETYARQTRRRHAHSCSRYPCAGSKAIGRAARAQARRQGARSIAVTGSAPARPAPRRCCGALLSKLGETLAAGKSFNNHWGVPLTLARMPAHDAVRRVRDRHEPRRRDHAPNADGAPARGDHHHGRAGAFWPSSIMSRTSLRRRPEIFLDLEQGGAAVAELSTIAHIVFSPRSALPPELDATIIRSAVTSARDETSRPLANRASRS